MVVRSKPDRNNRSTWNCAYCNFWDGDCGLKMYNMYTVQFDELARGKCIKTSSSRTAGLTACPKFEFSPNASRYVK